MDDRSNRALRGDFRVHTDNELLSMVTEDAKQRQDEADQQLSELTAIASLNDHPGWKMLKEKFEKRIAQYRSGETLSAMILTGDVSNEKLGELTRTTNLIAQELETLLITVEASVEARKDELDGRKRPQRRKI